MSIGWMVFIGFYAAMTMGSLARIAKALEDLIDLKRNGRSCPQCGCKVE